MRAVVSACKWLAVMTKIRSTFVEVDRKPLGCTFEQSTDPSTTAGEFNVVRNTAGSHQAQSGQTQLIRHPCSRSSINGASSAVQPRLRDRQRSLREAEPVKHISWIPEPHFMQHAEIPSALRLPFSVCLPVLSVCRTSLRCCLNTKINCNGPKTARAYRQCSLYLPVLFSSDFMGFFARNLSHCDSRQRFLR